MGLKAATEISRVRAWAARYGSAVGQAGRLVKWEEILTLTPHIILRPRAE